MGYSDIYALQALNGTNAKQEFIKAHSEDGWFKRFLYYALNPVLTYNISEKTLRKLVDTPPTDKNAKLVFFSDIFGCCEYLSRLRGVDDATLRQIQLLLYAHCEPDARELFIKLIAKTLRLGVTAKTVNKVIPHLIPEWEIQQAFPLDKYPIAEGTDFWLTQKLNGVRATFYHGKLLARSGVPYKGVDHITSALAWADELDYVLDGELTLKDKGELSDNEAFRMATGILNSDDENKTTICYTVFDLIPIQDFESANPKLNYEERRFIMESMSDRLNSEYTQLLPVLYRGHDQSKIGELLDRMVAEDKEGLMLNTNCQYRRMRHKGILKIKRFYTMDLPIIGYEEGTGRLEGVLGAFVLNYKGNEVKVGSGFTNQQRVDFWKHKDDIINKGCLCEVKYKEISSDKNTGLESLQFPVFVQLRHDKTEVSYG
ncbi:MAG: hypothetical protein K2F81_07095 [Ruminococcus sp.]|nr:hypothetical protein [Ruminococcus sp.]